LDLVLFYVIGFVTLLAGAGVVSARNVVHAALFLLTSMAGVAAAFVLLYAEFLALVQVLIYGGAIVIVILFALMLTRHGEFQVTAEHRRWPVAAVASIALFGLLAASVVLDDRARGTDARVGVGINRLGAELFERWAVPFEIASILLLVAMIGAIVIARGGGSDEP